MMDHDDDRIDFSSLDPARDERRWEAMIRTTAALARMRRTPGFAWQVTRWARPAIGLAASIAIIVWSLTLLRGTPNPSTETSGSWQLLEWARSDQIPADTDPTGIFRSAQ
jgi:hypothetical protein